MARGVLCLVLVVLVPATVAVDFYDPVVGGPTKKIRKKKSRSIQKISSPDLGDYFGGEVALLVAFTVLQSDVTTLQPL